MSTCSPNATGLPDRRAFLSTLTAAGALGLAATPALAMHSTITDPDAALLELGSLLTAAVELCDDLGERSDVAYEAYVELEIPEALLWQKRDFPSVWVDRHRLDGLGNPEGGSERYTYTSDGVLETLREKLARWQAVPIDDRFNFADIARVEEIVAGLDAWYAERERAFDACGFTAATEAYDAQSAAVDELMHRIAAMPAFTAEGVCIKARAALAVSHGAADWFEAQLAERLAASAPRLSEDRRGLLLLSAMIDAGKLGGASSGHRRAA